VSARFSKPVLPGNVLRTTWWRSDGAIGFRAETDDGLAIKSGYVTL
jgi:acyl dehydratase